ncbi:MAG: HEAT repeat domain-containing protein [Deltaproteobacteria bacterium]|nr:MAG: HEAT repeat domain-containing protein [Deltaproteobacteria bacterium]
MRATTLLGAAIAIAVAVIASPARAQPAEVAGQIKLIETQPPDMDRATWKDRRRDAARKLGQSKDKRAVGVLIRLAETETFDIIGEIAIEGLGNLGDPAAVPILQKIIADPARDKAQKDLARKALAKIGTDARPATGTGATGTGATGTGATGTGATGTGATGTGATGATGTKATGTTGAKATGTGGAASTEGGTSALGAGSLLGERPASDVPGPGALPAVADDALAAYERVTFAGGTANVGYDTARKRVDFDADVAGQYQKRVEREAFAWGWNAAAHIVAGYVNPDGPALTRGLQLDASADGEARLYSGQVYGIGRAAAQAQVNYISDVDPNNAGNTLKDTRSTADLQVAIGGGYGRVLDVGAAIRVRRLARTLEAARALGKRIDPTVARRLQLTWWALRGERSTYRALVATVAILREAGILLGEPDAGLSYEILNVLRDSQLYLRPSGVDLWLAVGEGYLKRPDQPTPIESGRVEQLLAQAAYGAQLDDDKLEISGGAYARLRLLAPANTPSPSAAGASARFRRFAYGEHGDPLGAIDVSASLQVSNDDLMNTQIGQRLTGQLGFTWWLNPASGVRLAASLGEDRGAVFFGAELTATYGLLDGTFAR